MLVGKEFGPYLIDKELGSGAMGTVFRGEHKTSGVRVAIKLMSLALGSNETALKRFTREISILKQLDHVNIVKYKGSGQYHKAPFYIMEYVEGESLDHVLHRRKRISWEEVVEIGIHLCAALQHAHDQGIVHRDLKPSNLMILKDGVVKLTDFGIAKDTDVTALTAANSAVGTAAYMSPEQCRSVRDISHKSDLYSMGIMFYELLTGRKPFVGESAMEIFLQHANKTDYRRPQEIVMDVPIWLDTLVVHLMEKEPEKRPLSASAVANTLGLIKEKVEAQRSAGVEAVTKRRVDWTAGDTKIAKEDTEAARAMAGKRKKKHSPAFYTQGWFTMLALMTVAGGFGTCVYFAVLKTPNAESLYVRAEALMKSDKDEDHTDARAGPIRSFLAFHRNHEKAGQVQDWADQCDFELRERQMHRRRKLKGRLTDNDKLEEQMARDALDEEDLGKLKDAAKRWTELSKRKGNLDPNLHAWGLVGERHVKELTIVDALHAQLREHRDGLVPDKLKARVVAAIGAEIARDKAVQAKDEGLAAKEKTTALDNWRALKEDTKDRPEQRRWFLLAAKQVRDLGEAK